MTRLIVALLALSLCACARRPQPGQGELFASGSEVAAKDDAICRSYGAQPGTPAYIQCRVTQDQRRDDFRKD